MKLRITLTLSMLTIAAALNMLLQSCGESSTVCFDCAVRCSDEEPCSFGHACNAGICDKSCLDALCKTQLGDRAECIGGAYGQCAIVEQCGRTVACADASSICDRTSFTCFPRLGTCRELKDCPLLFDGSLDQGLDCVGGFCRFISNSVTQLADASIGIIVSAPAAGAQLDSSEQFGVTFSASRGTYLLVVTTSQPNAVSDLQHDVVWYAATSTLRTVSWAQGSDGSDPDAPSALPKNIPLFLTVLRYVQGQLIDVSPVIPFTIGVGWKAPGDACDDLGATPGSCRQPTQLQACSTGGICRIVCASNRDCSTTLTSGVCDDPDRTGVRYCIPS